MRTDKQVLESLNLKFHLFGHNKYQYLLGMSQRVFNFSELQNFSSLKWANCTYLRGLWRRLTISSVESFWYIMGVKGSSLLLSTQFSDLGSRNVCVGVSVCVCVRDRKTQRREIHNHLLQKDANQIIYVKCFESTAHSWKRKVAWPKDVENLLFHENPKKGAWLQPALRQTDGWIDQLNFKGSYLRNLAHCGWEDWSVGGSWGESMEFSWNIRVSKCWHGSGMWAPSIPISTRTCPVVAPATHSKA